MNENKFKPEPYNQQREDVRKDISTPSKEENEWEREIRTNGNNWIREDKIIPFIKEQIQKAKEEERARIQGFIEGMKLKKDYDGNDLKTACDEYCIGAENWTEIIRYEDGYSSALQDLSQKIDHE